MKNDNVSLIAGSILLAGVVIAGSVIYSNNNGMGSGSDNIAQLGNLPEGAPGEVVNLPNRLSPNVLGSENAPVKIVEYSDFQCSFCERFYSQTYSSLKEKYVDTGKVQFEYRHFPLSFHENAQQAAEASECAADSGKFFEYHDILFENMQPDGTGLNENDLKGYAASLGLDSEKFDLCLDSGEKAEIVEDDLRSGTSLKVDGTPTVFVNGKRITGAQPLSVFEQAIEEALAK